MTLVELRTLFRLMAGPEFDELANGTIDDWINEAHRYICTAFRVYQRMTQLEFSGGVSSVDVPADFVSLDDEYGNAGTLLNSETNQGLIQIAPAEARLKTTTGHETHVWFWIWGRQIYGLPVALVAGIYNLLYFGTDTNLTEDGDSPSYAEVYHELLVTYALYRAYLSKVQEGTRDKRALTHWNLFKEQVTIVKAKEKGQGPPAA